MVGLRFAQHQPTCFVSRHPGILPQAKYPGSSKRVSSKRRFSGFRIFRRWRNSGMTGCSCEQAEYYSIPLNVSIGSSLEAL